MVKKIAILAIGVIVALLIIATLRLTRRGKYNEYLLKNGEDIETNPEKAQ